LRYGITENEPIWATVLKKLYERGLRGVLLVISDDHKGLW